MKGSYLIPNGEVEGEGRQWMEMSRGNNGFEDLFPNLVGRFEQVVEMDSRCSTHVQNCRSYIDKKRDVLCRRVLEQYAIFQTGKWCLFIKLEEKWDQITL
jgi:hypothetical protein